MLFEIHLGKYTLYKEEKSQRQKRTKKVQKDRNVSESINVTEIKMHRHYLGKRFLEIQMYFLHTY